MNHFQLVFYTLLPCTPCSGVDFHGHKNVEFRQRRRSGGMAVGSLCTTLLWRLSAGVTGWVTALLAFTRRRGCTLRLSKSCFRGFSVIPVLSFLHSLFYFVFAFSYLTSSVSSGIGGLRCFSTDVGVHPFYSALVVPCVAAILSH